MQDCFDNVDGILVVVTGHFTLQEITSRPFTHTFVLTTAAGVGGSYYVHNSVFRLQSEVKTPKADGASATESSVVPAKEFKEQHGKKEKKEKDSVSSEKVDKVENTKKKEEASVSVEKVEKVEKAEKAEKAKAPAPVAAEVAGPAEVAKVDKDPKEKKEKGEKKKVPAAEKAEKTEKTEKSEKKEEAVSISVSGAATATATASKATKPEEPAAPLSYASMAKRNSEAAAGAGGTLPLAIAPRRKPVAVKAESSPTESKPNTKQAAPNGNSHNSLYIKQINSKTDDAGLRALFGPFGDITRVDVNIPKMFAFVDFSTRDGLLAALAQKEPFQIAGATLRIEERAPKKKEGQTGGQSQSNGGKESRGTNGQNQQGSSSGTVKNNNKSKTNNSAGKTTQGQSGETKK